jgi:hypothetical protein
MTSRRARGVALLIVLVVLVLIATLATEIAITSRTTHQLATHSIDDLLLRTAVDGRVEILKAALRFDATNGSGYDGEADEWSFHNSQKLSGWGDRGASAMGQNTGDDTKTAAAYKNTDVQITAWCEDERSKLNLRGLMKPEDSPIFQHTRDTLIRIIDLYREGNSKRDLTDSDAKEMVDDLLKWLQAESDTSENPMPAVKPNRGRLQSIEDLLRVPGGHWTEERLYGGRDPDADESQEAASADSSSTSSDSGWEPPAAIPGLDRYLTVFAEANLPDPPLHINVNTASLVVLKALLDANDEDLAQKIVDYRRQGANDATSGTSGTSGSTTGGSTTGGTSPTDTTQGFFKSKADLGKVEGMDVVVKDDKSRFMSFADFSSAVYSLRVYAELPSKSGGADDSTDPSSTPKSDGPFINYREVVQRTNAGFVTLFTERIAERLTKKLRAVTVA